MKKILLFLSLFFISSVGVNATDGVVNGAYANSQISIPVSAQWYYRSGNEISTSFTPFLSSTSCNFGQCNYYSASTTSTDNLLSFNVGQTLETNYLYSLTVYVGSSKNVNLADVPSIVGFGNYNGGAKDSYLNGTCQATVFNVRHSYNIQYNVAQYYGVEDANELIKTGAYYWIIKSNCGYPVVNVPVSYASDPGQLRFFGYHIEPLGYANNLSNSDIQQIIDNSNLASSTSVEEVQNSVNQVQQELSNVNDSITSTEGPTNLGALDSSAGWLPAGPVDSILNLPLSLLNSLLTAVSSTCQPLNITFPFINFSYQLPCVSSIYAKISGLNAIIDLIGYTVGVLILYYYFKHLYKWIDDKITMQNDNDWGGI